MKTFGYTMRDKAGALKRGSLQALDRQEALQKIRSMGGTPVTVTEGGSPKASFVWQPAWTRAACMLGVGVALLAGVAFWLQRPRGAPIPARPSAHTPAAHTPAAPVVPSPSPGGADSPDSAAAPRPPAARPSLPSLPIQPPDSTGRAGPGPAARSTPDDPEPAPPARPAPFQSVTEQVLAIVASMPPGVEIPPMPELHGMENDFAKAATNTLVVFDTDGEELAHRLETVAWSKIEMSELIEKGWKADEVLKSLVEQHNEEANLRSAASLALKKMVDDGQLTAPALKNELKLINAELTERGLPEITFSELGVAEP